jgi:3-oxoacyl-[acyl-carrier protein] reductase
MRRFEGKAALVTGASRGLGRGIATALAAEGAFVFLGHRAHAAEAEAALGELRAAGGDGALIAIDVRRPGEVEAAFEKALARGPLDVLVNAAGVARDAPFALASRADLDEVLETNLAGTWACCRAAVRGMLARRAGAIVNVSSVAGLRASPGQAGYAASKAGILALTRTLAAEVAGKGVRVNAVVPGLFAAGMGERLDRRIVEARRAAIPAGRLGAPGELANAVLFLASDEASYVVGQALVVDGGLSL